MYVQFAAEYFKIKTGTDILFVPYKGGSLAIADALGVYRPHERGDPGRAGGPRRFRDDRWRAGDSRAHQWIARADDGPTAGRGLREGGARLQRHAPAEGESQVRERERPAPDGRPGIAKHAPHLADRRSGVSRASDTAPFVAPAAPCGHVVSCEFETRHRSADAFGNYKADTLAGCC